MNEDLSYTNYTLKTAGMAGYPLGDLYHWWPSQYASWKAQQTVKINIFKITSTEISVLTVYWLFRYFSHQHQTPNIPRADTVVLKMACGSSFFRLRMHGFAEPEFQYACCQGFDDGHYVYRYFTPEFCTILLVRSSVQQQWNERILVD